MRNALIAAAAAVTVLVAASGCDALDDVAAESDAAAGNASGDISLDDLTVVEERPAGYSRDDWSDWTDDDGNGCDTREEVLIDEDQSGQLTEADCGAAMTGEWHSWYDDEIITNSSDTDIDHMVPLAEAWASGGYDWSAEERADYATWLDDPDHLIAVTAASNRSKSDSDPAEWMPPDEAAHCDYVAAWIGVKLDWNLTVDDAEYDALSGYAADCDL